MHVRRTTVTPGARGGALGFSLVEVVIASGLLLVTVSALTFCVTSVSANEARLRGLMEADRAVRLVEEHLSAMPYWNAPPDGPGLLGIHADDVVGAVFPHADEARNTPLARYAPAAEAEGVPAGSFVTLFDEGGTAVRCVARFLAAEDGVPLDPADLDGWVVDGGRPPGCAVSVSLMAASHGTSRSVTFTLAALAPPLCPSLPGTVAS